MRQKVNSDQGKNRHGELFQLNPRPWSRADLEEVLAHHNPQNECNAASTMLGVASLALRDDQKNAGAERTGTGHNTAQQALPMSSRAAQGPYFEELDVLWLNCEWRHQETSSVVRHRHAHYLSLSWCGRHPRGTSLFLVKFR